MTAEIHETINVEVYIILSFYACACLENFSYVLSLIIKEYLVRDFCFLSVDTLIAKVMALIKVDETPSLLSQISQVCLFCLKMGNSKENVRERFFKILARFIGSSEGEEIKKLEIEGEVKKAIKYLNCCEDCGLIINSFCELYHQLKCLELQLEWKLGLLVNIMKFANRVPSRMMDIKRIILEETQNVNGGESMEWREKRLKRIKSVRTKLIRKCTRRLSKSQPRVTLSRKLDAWNRSPPSDSFPPNTLVGIPSSEENARVPNARLAEGFLGWSMSLAAVTLLASMTTQLGTTSYPAIQENSRNEKISNNSIEKDDRVDDSPPSPEPDAGAEDYHEDQMLSEGQTSEIDIEEDFGADPLATVVPSSPATFQVEEGGDTFRETDDISNNQVDHSMDLKLEECGTLKTDTDTEAQSLDVPTNCDDSIDNSPTLRSTKVSTRSIYNNPQEKKGATSSTAPPFHCKICKMTLQTEKGWRNHRHVIPTGSTTRPLSFHCDLCKMYFPTYSSFRIHKIQSQLHQQRAQMRNTGSMQPPLKNEPTDSSPDLDPEINSKSPPEPKPESPVPSSSKHPQRYNLREKRGTSFQEEMEGEVDPQDEEYYGSSDSSSSSSSDHSSGEDQERSADHIPELKNVTVKGNPSLLKFCGICQRKIMAKAYERHMTLHDKSGADPKDIVRCSIGDCSAYFVSRKGDGDRASRNLQEHTRQFHKISISRSDLKFCRVCKRKIMAKAYERHIALHDISGADPTDIVWCSVGTSCPAYFVKRKEDGDRAMRSLYQHKRQFHKIKNAREFNFTGRKRKFRCQLCKKLFFTQRDLEGHKKHHGSFKCQFCAVVKDFAPDLAFHESEEHAFRDEETQKGKNGRLVPCSRCPVNFFTANAFASHFLSVHLNVDSTGKPFSCSICQAGFTKGDVLEAHFNLFHKIDGAPDSEIFRCDLCPAYYRLGEQLRLHKFKFHFKRKCSECGKSYATDRLLKDHLEQKHPDFRLYSSSTFICDIGRCRKQFPSEKALDHHKKTFKGHQGCEEIVKCDVCEKEFKGKQKLYTHKKYAHKEDSVVCSECGKVAKTKGALKEHMKYHKGPDAWEFECSTCKRKFADKQKLDQHQRTHTKEKPFICQYCGEKYAHRHNWRNHVKTKHPEEFEQDCGK